MTFSIDETKPATTAAEAAATGMRIFTEAAAQAGLPEWPVVRLEAITWGEHDADLRRTAADGAGP